MSNLARLAGLGLIAALWFGCSPDETPRDLGTTPKDQGLESLPEWSVPSCTDKRQNGGETGVDCGGAICPKCGDGQGCKTYTDCLSGICGGGKCQPGCKHQPVQQRCARTVGIYFCKVPSGCFQMGSSSSESCSGTDEARHQVVLTRDFEIMQTEVGQKQFKALMGYNPSHFPKCGDTCPVEQLSWHEAAAFCNKLSEQAPKKKACYSCKGVGTKVECTVASDWRLGGKTIQDCPGFRLPSEAEWEYAYRGGTTTALHNGDITSCKSADTGLDKIAWYDKNAAGKTHPSGGKVANAWGLYDMAGNVREWCHDVYGTFPGGTVTDPLGAGGTTHPVRGGSFESPAGEARAASRTNEKPGAYSRKNGFRPVRSLP